MDDPGGRKREGGKGKARNGEVTSVKEYYVMFRSMTSAMGAAEKLAEVGLHLKPRGAPEVLRREGCGFCLVLQEGQFRAVREMLRYCRYERLYVLEKGHMKELALS